MRSLDALMRHMAGRKRKPPMHRPLGGVSGPQQREMRDGQEFFVRPILALTISVATQTELLTLSLNFGLAI